MKTKIMKIIFTILALGMFILFVYLFIQFPLTLLTIFFICMILSLFIMNMAIEIKNKNDKIYDKHNDLIN